MVFTREHATSLDESDPLAVYRQEFVDPMDDAVYMDGNSLGRMPLATPATIAATLDAWQQQKIIAWKDWIKWPAALGDLLAASLVEAKPGEIVFGDSTSVNLYKAAAAAISMRPGRKRIVTTSDMFPTDRYILQSLCDQHGLKYDVLSVDSVLSADPTSLEEALNDDVALVVLSHVAYLSGALLDMKAMTERVHNVGAIILWDVSHSVGSVRVPLTSSGADLAVGCSYKYLNGGPGAPAFTYVRRDLLGVLRQPIWGWFGHADQFSMADLYVPADDRRQLLVGAPSILSLAAIEPALRLSASAGIAALERKGQDLTRLLVALATKFLVPAGFELVSPMSESGRGSHITLRHPNAKALVKALIERQVIPDFRPPDMLRFGPAALYTRFTDVWDAVKTLMDVDRSVHLPNY